MFNARLSGPSIRLRGFLFRGKGVKCLRFRWKQSELLAEAFTLSLGISG